MTEEELAHDMHDNPLYWAEKYQAQEKELKWLQREHVKVCSSESKLKTALKETEALLTTAIKACKCL